MKDAFLVGENIYLRLIQEEDVTDEYRSWFNDPEVCQFNEHHRFPMDRERMREYFENVIKPRHDLVLAICDKVTDAHIGNVALQSIDKTSRHAEYAIIIGNKDFWGKGIAKEASKLIIKHGFGELNLHRIYCGTSSANIGMQKVAESLGFVKEGVSREVLWKEGKYNDAIQYGLLAHEFNG
ncbi:GNAT family N-acetyltransferase [Patescibacteria group bacterium]|jgi:RimJ/RimL family protein N-acetyltransferase|nr:GNAT family N-acetyltransferase [Patescibacteria group bacterium]